MSHKKLLVLLLQIREFCRCIGYLPYLYIWVFFRHVCKIAIVSTSFFMSACPSVCTHGATQLLLGGFSLNLKFGYFLKTCWENSSFIKNGQEHWVHYMKTHVHCSLLLRMRNVLGKTCRENQNTHFVLNNIVQKLCCLWDNVETFGRVRQATYDSMAHAHCLLDTCTNTLSEYVIVIAFQQQKYLHRCASVLTLDILCLSCVIAVLVLDEKGRSNFCPWCESI